MAVCVSLSHCCAFPEIQLTTDCHKRKLEECATVLILSKLSLDRKTHTHTDRHTYTDQQTDRQTDTETVTLLCPDVREATPQIFSFSILLSILVFCLFVCLFVVVVVVVVL